MKPLELASRAHPRRLRLTSLLGIVSILPVLLVESATATGQQVSPALPRITVENVGLATFVSSASSSDGKLAFIVIEGTAGDLNGDGDISDPSLFTYDPDLDLLTNVGLPASSDAEGFGLAFVSGHLAFGVLEDFGKPSLNGDTDPSDLVLHLLNLESMEIENTGYAIPKLSKRNLFPLDDALMFAVSEKDNGFTDLNNNGSTNDFVLHAWDPSTGSISNLGVGGATFSLMRRTGSGRYFPIIVREAVEGPTDLNWDGDTLDWLLYLYDTEDKLLIRTHQLAIEARAHDGFVSIVVPEFMSGPAGLVDLNGDGDTDDNVLHVMNVETGSVINLGADVRSQPLGQRLYAFVDGTLAYLIAESDQHPPRDLTSDGDLSDQVLQTYNVHTGERWTSPYAAQNSVFDLEGLALIQGNQLVYRVSESGSGGRDFNDDGDATDLVFFVRQSGGDQGVSTGLTGTASLAGSDLLIGVWETQQGLTDLNGDGDTFDRVLHAWNFCSRRTRNLGLTLTPNTIHPIVHQGNLTAVPVGEGLGQIADYNGDGDDEDVVYHLYDHDSRQVFSTRLAASGWALKRIDSDRQHLLLLASEIGQGATDLDGDGEVESAVLHRITFERGALQPRAFCFADDGSLGGNTPCPCGNRAAGPSCGGCSNVNERSAVLIPSRVPSVQFDSLRLSLEGASSMTFAALCSGTAALSTCATCPAGSGRVTPMLDGLRCVGGDLLRHGTRFTGPDGIPDPAWGSNDGPAGGLILSAQLSAGQTRYFQAFYRDSLIIHCGTGINTSNAVEVTALP